MSRASVADTAPPRLAGRSAVERPIGVVAPWATVAALLVVYAGLAGTYARVTPAFDNPDEPAHLTYVRQVAETGTLPVLQPGDWDSAQLERLKSSDFRSGESVDAIRYEGWQPPLYYLLAAPLFRGAGANQDAQVMALRWLGIVLGGATIVVTALLARAIFEPGNRARDADRGPDHWAPLAAAAVLVGVPMFTAMSAAITNDTLANLLAGVLTWRAAVTVRLAPTPARGARMGLLVALGLWTKLSLAVPGALAVAALLAAGGQRGAWRRGLLAAATAGLVAALGWAPWLVRQGFTYGWNDLLATHRHDLVVADQPRFPGFTADHLGYLATTTFHSFWAQFGWMAYPVDERLYWLWGLATLLAGLGLVVALVRWARGASPFPHLCLPWVVAAAVPLGMLAALAYYNLTFIQAQGRYLFPALPALGVLAVRGWAALAPRRVGASFALSAALLLVALNAWTLLRTVGPLFAGRS